MVEQRPRLYWNIRHDFEIVEGKSPTKKALRNMKSTWWLCTTVRVSGDNIKMLTAAQKA